MSSDNQQAQDNSVFKQVMDTSIKLGVVVLILVWCFDIIRPFIIPVAWGMIIAVAVYPLYVKLNQSLGDRKSLSATLLTIVALLILLVPSSSLTNSMIDSVLSIGHDLKDGTLVVPPPPDRVVEWPVVGKKLHAFWDRAATDTQEVLVEFAPQLKQLSSFILAKIASTGLGILQFMLSIILAGVFLATAAGGQQTVKQIATRLAGPKGLEFADLSAATIQSVAQGVLGIAIIQAILGGIGLLAAGVPGAGLWSLLILLLAVAQLPPIIILGPAIIYVFSVESTTVAVVFMVWSIFVSVSDSFLKPLLLGRGVEVPMLVILLGAIGGMISAGIIGLFVGAIVLSLGYTLFTQWLQEAGTDGAETAVNVPDEQDGS
jgi:predicted PurR-regulated permease PerM